MFVIICMFVTSYADLFWGSKLVTFFILKLTMVCNSIHFYVFVAVIFAFDRQFNFQPNRTRSRVMVCLCILLNIALVDLKNCTMMMTMTMTVAVVMEVVNLKWYSWWNDFKGFGYCYPVLYNFIYFQPLNNSFCR